MRTLMLAALAAVVAGCAGSDSPVAPVAQTLLNPVGSYQLVAVEGRPLPADLSGGDCHPAGLYCTSAGVLVVRPNGTYAWSFDWKRVRADGSIDQFGHFSEAGTWTAAAESATFSPIDSTWLPYVVRMPNATQIDLFDGHRYTFAPAA